jgi:MoaA/NifB/PqqE/SkfB family radical SAM enzyme
MVKLYQTISLCPICKKEISADIIEEYGSIFLEKECRRDGKYKVMLAKHGWYYKGLTDFYNKLHSRSSRVNRYRMRVLFLTSSCNLICPICFIGGNNKKHIPETSLDFIKAELRKIKNRRMVIRLSGGEPTLRRDLFEIIKLIKQSGNIPQLFTNGLMLQELSYLMKLKQAGLSSIIMWVDTLARENVYKQMRGQELIKIKAAALNNIKKISIPFLLYNVIAKGINEPDINDCFTYAKENIFVKGIWFRGYNHIGTEGLSRANEFVVDELIEEASRITNKAFTLEDVFNFQKIRYIISAFFSTPSCYLGPAIVIPRKGKKKSEFRKLSYILEDFERAFDENPMKSRILYVPKIIKGLFEIMPSLSTFGLRSLFKNNKGYLDPVSFLTSDYLFVVISSFYNAWNYDKNRIYKECGNSVFHLGVENYAPLCSLVSGQSNAVI